MENLKISLIVLFNEIVDLIPLLPIFLNQSVRPFDDVKADGAEGGQGGPFFSRCCQNPCGREKSHYVIGRQRKGRSATGPILEFL
jgi:hypothetical protein